MGGSVELPLDAIHLALHPLEHQMGCSGIRAELQPQGHPTISDHTFVQRRIALGIFS